MNTALKKINARVKVLQKKHPKSQRKTLQKQAGREWKAGKLKGAVGAVRKAKKKTARKKKPVVKVRVRTIVKVVKAKRRKYAGRKTKVKAYKTTRYRRVSGVGKMSPLVPIVAVAGLGLLAYFLISKPAMPTLLQTSNIQRQTAQNNILSYATALGLGASAIASLINALNNSSDDSVVSASYNPAAAIAQITGPQSTVQAPTGGPSIHI